MKTVDTTDEFTNVTIQGAFKGLALGAAVAIPGHFVLMARSSTYRALPIPLKAFAAVTVVVPCISITAEKAGERYNRSQWTGVGQQELQMKQKREETRLSKMSQLDRTTEWVKEHKYTVIAGSWAVATGIAFAVVARNPHQSFSQKLVQARMWSQGLTVATLVGSAMVAGATSGDAKPVQRVDHSWEDLLEAEGQMKHDDRIEVKEALKNEAARRQNEAQAKTTATAAA